jgi:hypothetical protein
MQVIATAVWFLQVFTANPHSLIYPIRTLLELAGGIDPDTARRKSLIRPSITALVHLYSLFLESL